MLCEIEPLNVFLSPQNVTLVSFCLLTIALLIRGDIVPGKRVKEYENMLAEERKNSAKWETLFLNTFSNLTKTTTAVEKAVDYLEKMGRQ